MSQYDRESLDVILARAQYERGMAVAEIFADGVRYLSRGIAKAFRAVAGLSSHKGAVGPMADA